MFVFSGTNDIALKDTEDPGLPVAMDEDSNDAFKTTQEATTTAATADERAELKETPVEG